MARFIRGLHQEGFEVYALDFPAHGEAKGLQLSWRDAVAIIKQTLDRFGPFFGIIGHSFGGSMVLNTLNLGSQHPKWRISNQPQRVVLLASPTRMHTPVRRIAHQLGISRKGYLWLRRLFQQQAEIDLKRLHFRNYISQATTPFLCVHGEKDGTVLPGESYLFCEKYPHATLELFPDLDHISILTDERVEERVLQFMTYGSPCSQPLDLSA